MTGGVRGQPAELFSNPKFQEQAIKHGGLKLTALANVEIRPQQDPIRDSGFQPNALKSMGSAIVIKKEQPSLRDRVGQATEDAPKTESVAKRTGVFTSDPMGEDLETIEMDQAKGSEVERDVRNSSPGTGKFAKVNSGTQSKLENLEQMRKGEDKLFDQEFVCLKIVKGLGNDPQKAIKILETLRNSDDVRFNNEKSGEGAFAFDADGVIEQLESMLPAGVEPDGNAEVTPKETKMAAMQLVGLVKREDVSEEFSVGDQKTAIVQKALHAETKDGSIGIAGKKTSASAELPKYERDVRTLANTASVQKQDGSVVCFRSAKTHKKHLQEQRSKADIASRVQASGSDLPTVAGESKNGLTRNADGSYDYQPVIFTMMDSNPLKAIGTSAQGLVKRLKHGIKMKFKKAKAVPIENERAFLKKMIKANNARFKGKAYIEHQVKKEDGTTATVREYPAIIQNHVFSGQSKKAGNRAQARKDNIAGQLQMLDKMVKKDPALFEDSGIDQLLLKAQKKPTQKRLETLSDAIKEAHGKAGDGTQKMVLQGFHANLTGKGINGHSYDERDSSADLAMLTGIQSDYLNLSFSPQCKSGNDRTIAATAHKIAQEAYKDIKGGYFNPESGDPGELEEYKGFYTQALSKFGFANVEASRGPQNEKGQSGLKIGGSPAAHKYMNREEVEKHGKIM